MSEVVTVLSEVRADFIVLSENGREVLRVKSPDGAVQFGEGATHEEASRLFWKYLGGFIAQQVAAGAAPTSQLLEGHNSQHVLKAEGESPDATDRENSANASPDGGPMGAGQAAAAAPAGGVPALPLNGIPATWAHDEGAYAQCGDCGRYSLDPTALSSRGMPTCECGSTTGWCGSFKKPGPDANWSGRAPGVLGTPTDWQISAIADKHRAECDGQKVLDEVSFGRELLSTYGVLGTPETKEPK